MKIKDLDNKLAELKQLHALKTDLESAITYFSKEKDLEFENRPASNGFLTLNNSSISGTGLVSFQSSPFSNKIYNLIRPSVLEVLNSELAKVNKQIEDLEI
jgi:hypothetical protein